MARNSNNYSQDRDTMENYNVNDKYSETGESEFSRESTIPFDQDEVLSERHYNFGPDEHLGKQRVRSRERRSEPSTFTPNYRGRGPKGYRRSDDLIKDDVSEALYRSTQVDASYIEVFVDKGIVTLKGTVDTRDQKRLAEFAIERLAGVDDVYNELKVRARDDGSAGKSEGRFGLTNNITGMN